MVAIRRVTLPDGTKVMMRDPEYRMYVAALEAEKQRGQIIPHVTEEEPYDFTYRQKGRVIPHVTKPEPYDFTYKMPSSELYDYSYLRHITGKLVCQSCQTDLSGKYVSGQFCPSCGATL